VPKGSIHRVRFATKLLTESTRREDRYISRPPVHNPTLPDDPHIKIQSAGRVRQGSNDLALHGDSVRVDFPVEGLAQSDGIVQALARYGLRLLRMAKPKSEVIEETETLPIDKTVSPWLIFGSEENGRGKDALKALHDPAVMTAILGQAEAGVPDISKIEIPCEQMDVLQLYRLASFRTSSSWERRNGSSPLLSRCKL